MSFTTIPTPQKINHKLQGVFYPLQKEELIALRQAKLINNNAFVHLALRYENPFCALRSRSRRDRPVEIIPKEFAKRWKIPESSIYKAISKLKKLGLILIKSGRLLIEWISASSAPKDEISSPPISSETIPNSAYQYNNTNQEAKLSDSANNYQIRESIIRSDNQLSKSAKNSQSRENQEPEALKNKDFNFSQTVQTNQTFYTLQTQKEQEILKNTYINKKKKDKSEISIKRKQEIKSRRQKKQLEGNSHPPQTTQAFEEISNDTLSAIEDQRIQDYGGGLENFGQEDNCHLSRINLNKITIKTNHPSAVVWQWLPDGPWVVNGKLDVNFQGWLAQKWVVKYGDDIYEAKANVLSYFRNDPVKLAIKWEQYQQEYIAKAQNIKLRLDHGCQVNQQQQQQAISQCNAIKPLLLEQEQTSGNSELRTQNSAVRTRVGVRRKRGFQGLEVNSSHSPLGMLTKRELGRGNDAIRITNEKCKLDNSELKISDLEIETQNYQESDFMEGEVIKNTECRMPNSGQQLPITNNATVAIDDDDVIENGEWRIKNAELREYNLDEDLWAEEENVECRMQNVEYKNAECRIENCLELRTPNSEFLTPNSEFRTHNSPIVTDKFGRSVRYQDFTGIAQRQSQKVSAQQHQNFVTVIRDFLHGFKSPTEEKGERSREICLNQGEQRTEVGDEFSSPHPAPHSHAASTENLGYSLNYKEGGENDVQS